MVSSTLSYDGENRQSIDYDSVSVTTIDYAYDGLGQRVSKTVVGGSGPTVYVYDALGNLAAEYAASNVAPACLTCYISQDHLGSTRIVTDESGVVVANGRHDYLPFGYEIPGGTGGRTSGYWGGPDQLTAKFTGQERDSETGLDHFPARYMASKQGRFMRPDPANAGADLTNPQSWNAYSYALNNPLAMVDPSGLCTVVNGVYREDEGNSCPADPSTSITVTDGGDFSVFTTNIPSGSCLSVILDGVQQPSNCDEGVPIFTVNVATATPPRSASVKATNSIANNARCAADNAASLADLLGISKSNWLGRAFLGNDISTIAQTVLGPGRLNSAGQVAISNPTPLNAIYQVGRRVGALDSGGMRLIETPVQDAWGYQQFYAKAISFAESAGGTFVSKAFALTSAAKLAFDIGAYSFAYARCSGMIK